MALFLILISLGISVLIISWIEAIRNNKNPNRVVTYI